MTIPIQNYNSVLDDLKELLGGLVDDVVELKSGLNALISKHNSLIRELGQGESLDPNYEEIYVVQPINAQARITK